MNATALLKPKHHEQGNQAWEPLYRCPGCRHPQSQLHTLGSRVTCDMCGNAFTAPLCGGQRVPVLAPQEQTSTTRLLEEITAQWNTANSANDVLRDEVHRLAPQHRAQQTLVYGARNGQLAYDLEKDFASDQTLLLDQNFALVSGIAQLVRGDRIEDANVKLRAQRIPINAHRVDLAVGSAHDLPLHDNTIDTLVTPNLLEQNVRLDLLAAQAARVLSLGGMWIHPGALAFDRSPVASPQAIERLLSDNGFQCIRLRVRKSSHRAAIHRLPSFAARLKC